MSHFHSRTCSLIAAGLVLLCSSCSSSGPRLHPVRGTVLFEGKPAEGATVVCQPVDDSIGMPRPSGLVGADGTFRLTTHPYGKGAPAGEYIVLVTWYPADARGVDEPQNKLPAQYADPALTPLPRVTIKPGNNTLDPFNLSAQ